MKQHEKDELGGAALGLGVVAALWLWLACAGCGPLPNVPNGRPTRSVERASHDSNPTFQPGGMPCITVLPPAGQYFDISGPVSMQLQYSDSSGAEQYRWTGRTCTRLGDILLGRASAYHPEPSGGGVIAARVTADSVTVWGNMGMYVPSEPLYYEIEVQVGTLLVHNDMRPIQRLSPITCRGKLVGCTIVGECVMDPGEQHGGELDGGLVFPLRRSR